MFDVALNKQEALKGLFEEVKLEKDKMMGWLRLKKIEDTLLCQKSKFSLLFGGQLLTNRVR